MKRIVLAIAILVLGWPWAVQAIGEQAPAPPTRQRLELVLLIDNTCSLRGDCGGVERPFDRNGERFQLAQAIVVQLRDLAERTNTEHSVALALFGREIVTRTDMLPVREGYAELLGTLRSMSVTVGTGSTAFAAPILDTMGLFTGDPYSHRAIVLLTDGQVSPYDEQAVSREFAELSITRDRFSRSGIDIFLVPFITLPSGAIAASEGTSLTVSSRRWTETLLPGAYFSDTQVMRGQVDGRANAVLLRVFASLPSVGVGAPMASPTHAATPISSPAPVSLTPRPVPTLGLSATASQAGPASTQVVRPVVTPTPLRVGVSTDSRAPNKIVGLLPQVDGWLQTPVALGWVVAVSMIVFILSIYLLRQFVVWLRYRHDGRELEALLSDGQLGEKEREKILEIASQRLPAMTFRAQHDRIIDTLCNRIIGSSDDCAQLRESFNVRATKGSQSCQLIVMRCSLKELPSKASIVGLTVSYKPTSFFDYRELFLSELTRFVASDGEYRKLTPRLQRALRDLAALVRLSPDVKPLPSVEKLIEICKLLEAYEEVGSGSQTSPLLGLVAIASCPEAQENQGVNGVRKYVRDLSKALRRGP